jgi:hypothetical protein
MLIRKTIHLVVDLNFSLKKRIADVNILKSMLAVRHQWLTPVILATGEAQIRRITYEASPGK